MKKNALPEGVKFTLVNIPNRRVFKMVGLACLILAVFIFSAALSLWMTEQISIGVFNLMMAISAIFLLEAFIVPKLLARFSKGQKIDFYDDHFRYHTPDGGFTYPYSHLTHIREKARKDLENFGGAKVSDIYLTINETDLPNFPRRYLYKGKLRLAAIPDEYNAVEKIKTLAPHIQTDKERDHVL